MTRNVMVAIVGGGLWLGMGMAGVVGAQGDPAKVAAGKTVFADTKCSTCHGPEGRGDKNDKLSLVGISAKLSVADIRKWITSPAEMTAKLSKKPTVAMKKFDLTDAQVDDLVAYIQSLKK